MSLIFCSLMATEARAIRLLACIVRGGVDFIGCLVHPGVNVLDGMVKMLLWSKEDLAKKRVSLVHVFPWKAVLVLEASGESLSLAATAMVCDDHNFDNRSGI